MDIELIVRTLHAKKLLTFFSQKRLITSFIPITLYIKLVRASLATKKPMAYVLATALEMYCTRMEEKHNQELQALAILEEKTPEDIILQEMETKANKED